MLKYLADQHYDRGERDRRLVFRQDGLGRRPSSSDSPTRAPAEPAPIGQYFGSSRSTGPRRLLENLYESSFCTHQLAGRVRNVFAFICTVGLLSAFSLLRATAAAGSGLGPPASASEHFDRIATEVVGFFAAGAFSNPPLCSTSSNEAPNARSSGVDSWERGQMSQRQQSSTKPPIMDCALAKARPLPTWAYRLRRDQLDKAWRQASRSGAV